MLVQRIATSGLPGLKYSKVFEIRQSIWNIQKINVTNKYETCPISEIITSNEKCLHKSTQKRRIRLMKKGTLIFWEARDTGNENILKLNRNFVIIVRETFTFSQIKDKLQIKMVATALIRALKNECHIKCEGKWLKFSRKVAYDILLEKAPLRDFLTFCVSNSIWDLHTGVTLRFIVCDQKIGRITPWLWDMALWMSVQA